MGASHDLSQREEHRLIEIGERRRLFRPERERERERERCVAGGWGKLRKEETHNLYPSPNIIRVIKSRRIRWARHVARTREMRNASRYGQKI
jgi:hypothetical protein